MPNCDFFERARARNVFGTPWVDARREHASGLHSHAPSRGGDTSLARSQCCSPCRFSGKGLHFLRCPPGRKGARGVRACANCGRRYSRDDVAGTCTRPGWGERRAGWGWGWEWGVGGCARLNQRSSELMRVPPGARERTHRGRAHWHRVPRPETGGRGGAPRRGGSEQPIRPAAVHPGRARQARVLDARPKGARPAAHDRGRRCNVRNEAAHEPQLRRPTLDRSRAANASCTGMRVDSAYQAWRARHPRKPHPFAKGSRPTMPPSKYVGPPQPLAPRCTFKWR